MCVMRLAAEIVLAIDSKVRRNRFQWLDHVMVWIADTFDTSPEGPLF